MIYRIFRYLPLILLTIGIGLIGAWLIHGGDRAATLAKVKYTGDFTYQSEPGQVLHLALFLDGTFELDGGSCGASKGNWELHDSDVGHVIEFKANDGFHAQAAASENELGFFSSPINLGYCTLKHSQFQRVGSE